MTYQEKINAIKNDEAYKQVMADSFGGIIYNVANLGKYDSKNIMEIWENMKAGEKECAGGIVKGAIDFLKGE